MKKIIITLLVLSSMPLTGFALNDCPYGNVEEAYPGKCGLYTDQDENGICDHSQSTLGTDTKEITSIIDEKPPVNEAVTNELDKTNVEGVVAENIEEAKAGQSFDDLVDLIDGKDLKQKTVQEIADIYEISGVQYAEGLSRVYGTKIKASDSFQLLHDNYAIEPSVAKDIAASVKLGETLELAPIKKEHNDIYNLREITLSIMFIYILMRILLKKKKISLMTHKRFWNVILLIAFLISGILGILLVIRVNTGTVFPLPFNILFWHAEIGIVMVVISILHIIERWYFFKSMISGMLKGK